MENQRIIQEVSNKTSAWLQLFTRIPSLDQLPCSNSTIKKCCLIDTNWNSLASDHTQS